MLSFTGVFQISAAIECFSSGIYTILIAILILTGFDQPSLDASFKHALHIGADHKALFIGKELQAVHRQGITSSLR